MSYHQNSAGHGGRRCETARKTEVKIHGHHQEGHQKECADGRQHSRPQELDIGSAQGDTLTWKSLQGEKVRSGENVINHLMYADDIVLLSPSAKGMQRLVDNAYRAYIWVWI